MAFHGSVRAVRMNNSGFVGIGTTRGTGAESFWLKQGDNFRELG